MKIKKSIKMVALVGLIGAAFYNPEPAIKNTEIYIVKSGDTIYDIASEYTKKDSRYINQIIYDIIKDNPELNGKSGNITPGQKLVINIK